MFRVCHTNNSHGADVEDIPFGIEVRRPVVEFPAREALDVIYAKKNEINQKEIRKMIRIEKKK
jgi:hypothetical protein